MNVALDRKLGLTLGVAAVAFVSAFTYRQDGGWALEPWQYLLCIAIGGLCGLFIGWAYEQPPRTVKLYNTRADCTTCNPTTEGQQDD